ncbi:MAG: M28 family peptidase, partial [Gemmatimonadetes bacterium]|nr:M28 family peptidase [Gemmatimonadota bacterium]
MRIWAARHALTLALGLGAAACRAAGDVEIRSDPVSLRFSGERAFALEAELVRQFPRRHSGQPNNRRAVEWLRAHFAGLGLACSVDDWEVVNYSRPVGLRNLACSLPGRSGREIVLVAHHDHSPATIQGADNDGSGVAILMHLAELFAADVAAGGPPAHTLVFLSADAEEYGMLGSRRYVRTHPDRDRLIAAISLDNLGKKWAVGLEMSPLGQFRGYGALWLQRLAQAAARAASGIWVPRMHSPLEQAVDQAVPVSLMDQGPFVAAGVPALGFANVYDPAARDEAWRTYHSPDDVIEYQSPEVLGQSGR